MFLEESINMQTKILKQKSAFIAILLFYVQVESDTDHLNYLNTSVVTWNKTTLTAGTCLMSCADGSSCKSVFYHPQRHLCMGSSSYKRALPDNEKADSGWMYYSEQYGCNEGYTHIGSNGLCLKLHTKSLNFHDAMGVCEAEGAKLALFDNKQQLSDIQAMFENPGTIAWIGMTDLVKEGEWKFWNGKTPEILPWDRYQPNGGVNENCALLFAYKSLMSDYPCASKFYFICQR